MNELEDLVLLAVDSLSEQTNDRTTKILVDLFKSNLLEKYKNTFDSEILRKRVHKENLSKAIEFCFAEASVKLRLYPLLTDIEKENTIRSTKLSLNTIKEMICDILIKNGVEVI